MRSTPRYPASSRALPRPWLVILCCCAVLFSVPAGAPAQPTDTPESPADLEESPDGGRLADEVGTGDPVDLRHVTRQGIRLVKQGEYAEAIALLEPHRDVAEYSLLHALGIAYVRTQRNREAYDILLRAHSLKPEEPGPLLPAALACARMAKSCDEYRRLALQYKELGGRLVRFADRIAEYQPITLSAPKRF